MGSIGRLLQREDFRRDPVRALWRRLWWRLRWRATRRPWLRTWHDGLRILLPRGGPAALVYYQGFSEPDTARFILGHLKPGMVFLDVGAHIGEYSLLAAQRVGAGGQVHAFEPNPAVHAILVENVRLNGLSQVVVRPWAVSDAEGEVALELAPEPALSALAHPFPPGRRPLPLARVPCVTLDGYRGDARVDVVKIDVEGAEVQVMRGAGKLLGRQGADAPLLVFECSVLNYARFGSTPRDAFQLLRAHGYSIWRPEGWPGRLVPAAEPPSGTTVNLIASKQEPPPPLAP
jgi:FkbM family methyltransferase